MYTIVLSKTRNCSHGPQRRDPAHNGQGGAEGTDERLLSLHADACEIVEVTSVEERHGVESDVAEETMSALVKLVTEICESCDIGQPAAPMPADGVALQHRKLVTQRCELRQAQGGAEVTEERVLTLVFLCPLWKAMISSTSRPADCEGWFMVKSMRLSPTNKVAQA